jgi:hypothetical protein
MKKIFTISALALILGLLFTSCVKQSPYGDDSYWLTKERGEVVYSTPYCAYYIVETNGGYSILRAGNYRPYEGETIYGDFSRYGYLEIYSRSRGNVFTGEVSEYWLSYYEAQQAIDYYCY